MPNAPLSRLVALVDIAAADNAESSGGGGLTLVAERRRIAADERNDRLILSTMTPLIPLIVCLSTLIIGSLAVDSIVVKRVMTLDSTIGAGQHTQALLVRRGPSAAAQLLVFYHFAGAQASDSELRVVTCVDALCRQTARRVLDDGSRGGGSIQLDDCGRFIKAVLLNDSIPMLTYACGDRIARLVCNDPLCAKFLIVDIARSGLGANDRASYSAPLNDTDLPVFFHAHSSRTRLSELRAAIPVKNSNYMFNIVTIDNDVEAGLYPSAVFAPNGQLAVAYVARDELRFAVFNWQQNTFDIVVVDNSSSYRYVTATLVGSLPLIAYTDEINGFEKTAWCSQWPCNDPSLFSNSAIDQIGRAPNSCSGTPFCPYGVFPQLRSGLALNDGLGVLVYFNSSSPQSGALKMAQCNSASCDTATVDVIASAPLGGFGRDSSLAANANNQLAYVSFLNYGGSDTNMTLGLVIAQF